MIVFSTPRLSDSLITLHVLSLLFFFNDTATTEIYTLSLHDALPICRRPFLSYTRVWHERRYVWLGHCARRPRASWRDRKSTRLNSSHANISYAVFCLKKKKIQTSANKGVVSEPA